MNEIPKKPRYEYVMKKVYEFIINNNISYYPLDIINIIRQNKWDVTKYSELEKKFNCNNDTVCKHFQSNDGKTYLSIKNENYIYSIVYNDDLSVNTYARMRFTLAHEIGHIYLNHLKNFPQTEIQRYGLDNKSYSILEKEADMFARNLLCPYPLTKRVIKILENTEENIKILSEIFKISKQASKIRLNLLNYDKKYTLNYDINKIKIIYDKYCKICGNFKIFNYYKCNLCGNYFEYNSLDYTQFKEDTNNIMQYSYFKYNQCDNCENENIIDNSNFCHICGTDLRNICVNEDCDNNNFSLPYNARFCNLCGSHSSFYEKELLPDWQIEMEEKNKEIINNYCDDDNLPF